MSWPRYLLNYAFNTNDFKMFKEIKQEDEVLEYINSHMVNPTTTGLHEVLKLFVTSEYEKPIKAIKEKLRTIANGLYRDNVLDGEREAFLEAIDINIVYVPCISAWDYDQWTLKENLEAKEEELF